MKRLIFSLFTLHSSLTPFGGQGASAQNPIVSHCYTADPAPAVFEGNDSLYFYCDEDMNVPGVNDFYYMERYRVYSTVDMVNWTDHGVAMPRTAFKWGREGTCWASQCVKRGETYYWYICLSKPNDWRHYIGVGKSSKPSGPFTDARKQPIFDTGEGGDIDPTVFIDDDGQGYLYWGNNKCRYALLNDNMIMIKKTIGTDGVVEVPLTKEAFGGVKVDDKVDGVDCYEEGPWLDKRGDNYYLIYAAGGVPEHISYSMSKSPTGPWEYKGQVMTQQNTGSFTNHSGLVHYKGKDYFFYHSGWAPGGGSYNRSTCVEEIHFNEDGTIQPVTATKTGVKALCTMNPYERQQAETLNAAYGVEVVGNESKGVYVTNIHSGDSMRVANLDFGTNGAESITLRYASDIKVGYLILRLGHSKGKQIAKIKIESTGGESEWVEKTFELTSVPKGTQNIHMSFAGATTNLCNFDWWKFNEVGTATDITTAPSLTPSHDNRYYDLTGRPVTHPTHGIYVRNGKKVLVPSK